MMASRTRMVVLAFLFCGSNANAEALRWSLVGDSQSWPAGESDTITRSMNEGVAVYNQYGLFDKAVTATYNPGVPTAQSNYGGYIEFGASNNTRVAIHELAHTLGTGTYWAFDNGTWDPASAAGRLEKVYDGQNAVLSTGGTHFWPYGLNYDNEDGSGARERHCKLVAAFRWDMGIVKDSDSDGMPDDWETFHFNGLTQGAADDPDADGISNLDEYDSDGDPTQACPLQEGRRFLVRSQLSDRTLTLKGTATEGTAVTLQSQAAVAWTAHYVGKGYWQFSTDDGWVLEVPSNDTTDGLPLHIAKSTNAMQQQWRVVSGPGAKAGYWVVANRQTGRVMDGNDGKENTEVHQWQFVGDVPQQFWSFTEDSGIPDAGASDASPDAAGSGASGGAGGMNAGAGGANAGAGGTNAGAGGMNAGAGGMYGGGGGSSGGMPVGANGESGTSGDSVVRSTSEGGCACAIRVLHRDVVNTRWTLAGLALYAARAARRRRYPRRRFLRSWTSKVESGAPNDASAR